MMLNVLSQQTPKSSRKLEFREQFSPRLISALYKNFKDANSAILELIDNAIDDRIPGKLFVITVEVHGNKITIINKGGKGMGPRELEVFFIWGQSKKRGKLGRYGQGGKAAMGYLGKSWKISTTKAGDKNEYIIEEKNLSISNFKKALKYISTTLRKNSSYLEVTSKATEAIYTSIKKNFFNM